MNNRQEQIEQAKRLIATGISEELVEVLHQQFPELKESEDERIINQLISLVRSTGGVVIIPTNQEELITYLERMKEQKPEIKYVYPIFKVGDTIKPKAYNESHRINKIKDDNYVLDNGFTFPIVGQDVWEIVEQEQPEVNLKKEIDRWFGEKYMQNMEGLPIKPIVQIIARHFHGLRNRALEEAARHVYESWTGGTMDDVRRDMVELGKVLNARKED